MPHYIVSEKSIYKRKRTEVESSQLSIGEGGHLKLYTALYYTTLARPLLLFCNMFTS